MYEPIETNPSRRVVDDARLLVMGYQGTLRSVHSQNLPPAMEALLEPWLEQARQSLSQRIPQQHRVFQGEAIPWDSLIPALKNRLIGILAQAAAAVGMEAHPVAADDLFREFPLLSSLVHSAVSGWVAAIATFLQRLHQDQTWLAASLQCSNLPPIESISATASDAHAGGHSVLRVGFHGGSCLYYKPRPMTGEWLWHELLSAIARLDPQFPLPSTRVFPRAPDSRYGWVESVFAEEARSFRPSDANPSAAFDYWHAAGAVLCLAQFVRLTDLHLGNIIATSHGPAVTDAECLATPNLHPSPSQPQLSHAIDAILATGLLPRKRDAELPDVSGLFGHAAPVPGIRLPAWTQSSDRRHYQLTPVAAELVDHGNAPTQTTPIAILPQLVEGYRHAANLLIRARKTLLAPGSPWRLMLEKQHAPRIVLRDTLTYGLLLSRSLEPQSLASVYRRRNAIIDELQSPTSRPLPPAVLRAELGSILRLHVPRFTMSPGSRTLTADSGRAIARRFVASTPARTILNSIETLSPQNVENLHIPALLTAIL